MDTLTVGDRCLVHSLQSEAGLLLNGQHVTFVKAIIQNGRKRRAVYILLLGDLSCTNSGQIYAACIATTIGISPSNSGAICFACHAGSITARNIGDVGQNYAACISAFGGISPSNGSTENIWTMTIVNTAIEELAGAAVTQGSSSGKLKVLLTGASTTSVVITAVSGVTFDALKSTSHGCCCTFIIISKRIREILSWRWWLLPMREVTKRKM